MSSEGSSMRSSSTVPLGRPSSQASVALVAREWGFGELLTRWKRKAKPGKVAFGGSGRRVTRNWRSGWFFGMRCSSVRN